MSLQVERGWSTILRDARGGFALALMALVSSCVMPVKASRMTRPDLIIPLSAPVPFDPTAFTASEQPQAQGPAPAFSPTQLVSGPAASAYVFRGQSAQDFLRATLCLTSAIYYEAGNEPEEGQRAVAQVVLNRVRHPAYPDTVCGVVYQGTDRGDTLCQFTFGCDGSMSRSPDAQGWARARRIALEALSGAVYSPVGLSTHYHTLAVNPSWNRSLSPTAIVGAHIFFRWPGGAGSPSAFHASYRGGEPVPAPKLPVRMTLADPAALLDFQLANDHSDMAREVPMPRSATVAGDDRYVPGALPESDVLPAYRDSGQWIGS